MIRQLLSHMVLKNPTNNTRLIFDVLRKKQALNHLKYIFEICQYLISTLRKNLEPNYRQDVRHE